MGNILGKGKKPMGGFITEIVLRVVTFICVPVQFGSVLWGEFVWSLPVFLMMREAGLILMLIGVIVFFMAIFTMKNNWRTGYNHEQDTQLVTYGIYNFSRNPAFVGFDLLYIGCALAFPNIVYVALSLVAVIVFHVQILGEEKFLEQKFGEKYLKYKAKVRRYI